MNKEKEFNLSNEIQDLEGKAVIWTGKMTYSHTINGGVSKE